MSALNRWLTWLEARAGVAARNAEAAQVDLQKVRRLERAVGGRNLPADIIMQVARFAHDYEARIRSLGILADDANPVSR